MIILMPIELTLLLDFSDIYEEWRQIFAIVYNMMLCCSCFGCSKKWGFFT